MSIDKDFETFCTELKILQERRSEFETSVAEITKKLNNSYYGLLDNITEHIYIVGSVGRGTAISGVSDIDIIFDLPDETYKKFNGYSVNGQSAILQEVKNVLKERYPKTDLKGDGQVVVINFSKYTIELVPGFKQSDDSFKYPNSNDGGSWKITKPLLEIEECESVAKDTNGVFIHLCDMLRAWKNKQGFKFSGLLIDTLSYNFLNDSNYEKYKNVEYKDYLNMIKDLFFYLKGLNKEQDYWYALGSNQLIYNTTKGKFVTKAGKAYNIVKDLEESSESINKELRKVFGRKFPKAETTTTNSYNQIRKYAFVDNEQFISDIMPVDIQYDIEMDCTVTQAGFRPSSLREMLRDRVLLKPNKELKFEIRNLPTDLIGADIYWKVKNTGAVAERKNMLRGQINKTNDLVQKEKTSFSGAHHVECYIALNGICVGRSRIEVPITD